MKKISKVLLMVILLMGLVACNNNSESVFGSYDKNVYTNKHFGFKLTYPEASKYKSAEALDAEQTDNDTTVRKVAEIKDYEGVDMLVMITDGIEEDHTIDKEIEKITEFYMGSGLLFEPVELTRDVAGKEYRLLTMKMARSDVDQDIYYRIEGDKLISIHFTYPKDQQDKAKEMVNWYEAI